MQQNQEIINQSQDRRMKPMMQGDNQNPSQNQQPQKCPRCESMNTKFCYYNNYSLSQPRYFCKTCRRYWTQGGTLRNVPVGGGCRKGKRIKTSSSSSPNLLVSSSDQDSRPQTLINTSADLGLKTKESRNFVSAAPDIPRISSITAFNYSASGFLMNSIGPIQPNFNNQSPVSQAFTLNHQQLGGGGDQFGGVASNVSIFHAVNPFGSSQIEQQRQFYHLGSRDNKNGIEGNPFYVANSSSENYHQQRNWSDFITSASTNTNPTTISDTGLWSVSTSTSTTTGNNHSSIRNNTNGGNNDGGGGSLASNPVNPWSRDLSGYGHPP